MHTTAEQIRVAVLAASICLTPFAVPAQDQSVSQAETAKPAEGKPVATAKPVIVHPKLIYSEPPIYPEDARRAHKSGTVLVGLTVRTDGVPQLCQIVRSTDPLFNVAALKAVAKYRFAPQTEDGKPTPVHIAVEVNFSLH